MHRGGSTNFFFQVFRNCQERWLFLEACEKYTGPSSEDGVSLGGFGWSMDMGDWDVLMTVGHRHAPPLQDCAGVETTRLKNQIFVFEMGRYCAAGGGGSCAHSS